MLGHLVHFRYCRTFGKLPCRRVLQCWSRQMNVAAFLESNYSADEITGILGPPQPKLHQLLDLVQKARDEAR